MTPARKPRVQRPAARRMAPKPGGIVVTGFEPFGDLTANPTAWAVHALLAARPVPGLVGHVLPVAYDEATRAIDAILDTRPRAMLMLGVSKSAAAIQVERYAHNLDDARAPDNRGATRVDQPIDPTGPVAYAATVPVLAIRDGLCAAGIPAQVSSTAGHYLCNHAYYRALHGAPARGLDLAVGFLHVPVFPDQAAQIEPRPPSMSRETLIAGVILALRLVAASSDTVAR